MIRLNLKALSLNSAYRGRRFTTPALSSYKQAIGLLSPILSVPEGKLKVKYVFGVSSKNSDGDNLIKCLQDALAEKYGFNDKMIYKWEVEKVDVKKGEEFIEFEITK
jgi:Holliday junction resolvase RusA-like endonuclease